MIHTDHFSQACTILRMGCTLSGCAFRHSQLRDMFGFCSIDGLADGTHLIVGVIENHMRPGLIIQKTDDLDFPRGNSTVTIRSKKISISKGSYFVDAEVFDHWMIGQSMTATP